MSQIFSCHAGDAWAYFVLSAATQGCFQVYSASNAQRLTMLGTTSAVELEAALFSSSRQNRMCTGINIMAADNL